MVHRQQWHYYYLIQDIVEIWIMIWKSIFLTEIPAGGRFCSNPSPDRVKHLCCDLCAGTCSCEEKNCKDYEHPCIYNEFQDTSDDDSDPESESDTDSF